ncbi:hypothetical protein F4805DRAFT_415278 [Annulohypoxylon moriforme]|nr:hypothetical protein F4805DRAFT_415278 [Annulohypoxylon moriforme]
MSDYSQITTSDFPPDVHENDFEFDLLIDPTANPAYKESQVRTHYEVSDESVPIFEGEKSDCRVTVERLLWVDGWRDGKDQEKPKHMTLVVLKFNFLSKARGNNATKLDWVDASLRFLDTDQTRHQDPEVVAWAPCDPEKWNFSSAKRKSTTKTGGSLSAGYQGVNASIDRSKENEIQWDQVCFDEGRTELIYSKKTGRPNGVLWFLRQNPLQNHGVLPQFWTAFLISRQSSKEYNVKFDIESGSGSFDNAKSAMANFLRIPRDGSTFIITPQPGKVAICNLEGKDIEKSVDLEHLGRLVDPEKSTKLNLKWTPPPKEERPAPAGPTTGEEGLGETAGIGGTARALDDRTTPTETPQHPTLPGATVVPRTFIEVSNMTLSSTAQPALGGSNQTPQQMAWDHLKVSSTSVIDYNSRLVLLETRMAQLETRLAAQDVIISQLKTRN